MKYKIGMKVKANIIITDGGGETKPDFKATDFKNNPGFVHAVPGDIGTVVYVDEDNVPTVRFKIKGTATIVGDNEISIIG